ncbi:MAG TPA: hypothetical protein VE476_06915 [Propionibacteriaceae bacterium]|nr:hypothetical protein [Propionibacteriaceae bacterium]
MSPRRRAVERATRRQMLTDRIVIGTLVVVALSGMMSVLPAYTQVAVSRFACRVGSLGLGSCGAPGINLGNSQLAPARCTVLGTLDEALPEVRVEQVTTSQGLPVTISQARSGDVYVALDGAEQPSPPDLLAGETRALRTVLPGVAVPGQAEWYLPRGQGLDQLVTAAHGEHQQWFERQSALALVGSRLFGPHQEVPPPALLFSEVRLDEPRLPRFGDRAAPPRTDRSPKRQTGPVAAVNSLRLDPKVPGLAVVNRISGTAATVASLRGTLRQRPVTGALRWTRNADGVITSVLVTVVGNFRMAPGERLGSLPGPAVAYISIPVTTPPEQRLVQAWLADPVGVTVPLSELLGLRPARTSDQLGSFLTRAATVTILRYAFVAPQDLQARALGELATLRRQDWTGIRMVAASSIAPQPSGGRRQIVEDPSCRT